MRSVTVRNAEIILHFRVIEIEHADVARVSPEGELALLAQLARFLCVDEPAEHIAVIMDLVHNHTVGLNRAFKERHQIQSQSVLINNASWQTAPKYLLRSQNPFLILLNRRGH